MIYFVRCELTRLVKIGYTNQREIAARTRPMQTGSPGEQRLVGTMAGGLCEERVLQGKYAHRHVRGEWFALTDEDLKSEPLRQAWWTQAGREADAWNRDRYRESGIRNERRGYGMAASIEMERTFLDEMEPRRRAEYVSEMLGRWRALRATARKKEPAGTGGDSAA